MTTGNVKCFYCGESFNKDKELWVKPNSTRYAHKECYENRYDYLSDENKILEKCKELFKEEYNQTRIKSQIKKYLKEGKTASGIYKSLIYFFEVKNNDVSKANGGIGIVPYIYDEAKKYYASQEKLKEKFNAVQLAPQKQVIRQIKRKKVQKPVNLDFFNLH